MTEKMEKWIASENLLSPFNQSSRMETSQQEEDVVIIKEHESGRIPQRPSYFSTSLSCNVRNVFFSGEDLAILIETYRNVNKHLDGQVETLTRELEELKKDRDSWKDHAMTLAKTLNRTKQEANLAPVIEDIDEGKVQSMCRSLEQDEDLEDLERDGIVAETLMKRALAANCFINPNKVVFEKKIGEGAFGTTYKGLWCGGKICIKCVKVNKHEDAVSFYREIEALSSLRHPNILPFIGASIQRPDHCWLLCEYMPGGTLSRWLYGDRSSQRTAIERLDHALSIARGMELCASYDPPIVHRDLKPSNVFLDGGGIARIGDFGLARRLNPEGISTLTGETGTYFYMSPEMVHHQAYTSSTDVWSWGVLTCELLNKSLPYQNHYLTPIQVAVAVGKGELKPSFPTDIHPKLSELLGSVFQLEGSERPTFKTIVSELSQIVSELRETSQPEGLVQRFLRLTSSQHSSS